MDVGFKQCLHFASHHTPLRDSIAGAHLPLLGLEPAGGEPLTSVTRGLR